jgi:hypothetical protein
MTVANGPVSFTTRVSADLQHDRKHQAERSNVVVVTMKPRTRLAKQTVSFVANHQRRRDGHHTHILRFYL